MAKLTIRSKGKVVLETSNPKHVANAEANLKALQDRKIEIRTKLSKQKKRLA